MPGRGAGSARARSTSGSIKLFQPIGKRLLSLFGGRNPDYNNNGQPLTIERDETATPLRLPEGVALVQIGFSEFGHRMFNRSWASIPSAQVGCPRRGVTLGRAPRWRPAAKVGQHGLS